MFTGEETKAWTNKMTYPQSQTEEMEVWEFEANYLCLQSLCSSFHTACLSHHTNSTSWIAQSSPTSFHEIKPKSQKCFLPETVGTHCLPFTDLETNGEKVMMWDTWHRASFQDCHFPWTTFTSLIASLRFSRPCKGASLLPLLSSPEVYISMRTKSKAWYFKSSFGQWQVIWKYTSQSSLIFPPTSPVTNGLMYVPTPFISSTPLTCSSQPWIPFLTYTPGTVF